MKIRFREACEVSSSDGRASYGRGATDDLPEGEARQLIDQGLAEALAGRRAVAVKIGPKVESKIRLRISSCCNVDGQQCGPGDYVSADPETAKTLIRFNKARPAVTA